VARPATRAALLAVAAASLALLAAGLACGPVGGGPDTVATVNAVSTNVRQTLEAGQPVIASATLAPSTAVGPTTTPLILPVTFTPSPTTAIVLPQPTPGAPARPNGPILLATRLAVPPGIDGFLGDWPDLPHNADQAIFRPENWTGPGDLSGRYALAWDDGYLYLAIQVTDDAHVQTQRGELLYQGDSAEILLDADLRADFDSAQLSGDDFQFGFSPGAQPGEAAEAYLWFPAERADSPSGVLVATQATDLGYNLEAAIPWTALGLSAPPRPETRFGFVLSLSDNDTPDTAEQQSLVTGVSTRRLTDPTTWGTLELGD
jgi:hypothetical protein